MIRSMTGYGSASGDWNGAGIRVEMKSVNNRYFDFNLKIPRAYMSIEEKMKQLVQTRISRGKVDMFVTLDLSKAALDEIRVNFSLARSYVEAVRAVAREFALPDKLTASDVLRFPDVMSVERDEADAEGLYAAILSVAEDALCAFDNFRAREGERLGDDIALRLGEIERLTSLAEARSAESIPEYRAKLLARMEEMFQNRQIDESRIITEAAISADKTAIIEEAVRLCSHVSELREMQKSREPIGRKLDFLVQELNRESNTIASKGNDAEMARIAVDLKAEVEKIREQAQNIE
ncbi:MAG: YicC family protein [Clostridiales bacterium]|nr:YicC family protein [Clostridiales bacterium]